jgi:hypothetical protein
MTGNRVPPECSPALACALSTALRLYYRQAYAAAAVSLERVRYSVRVSQCVENTWLIGFWFVGVL